MGELVLRKLGGIATSANTAKEYHFEGSEEGLRAHILSVKDAIKHANKARYIVGMGGTTRETDAKIKGMAGVELIWSRSVLPKYLRIIAGLVASESGLIRIEDVEKFPVVFSLLTEMAMAGVYVFDQEFEPEFVEQVTRDLLSADLSYGIRADPGYFMYVVDGDSHESKTGVYEIVSYGHKADCVPSVL